MISSLADSVARHLARLALIHHRKERANAYLWGRQTEADVVRIVEACFDGLGYIPWREQPYPGAGSSKKMDLWAEPPLHSEADPHWFVEVKAIVDNADNRCRRDRFHADREILKDFDHCAAWCSRPDRWAVVWVVFSSDGAPTKAGGSANMLRLRDLIQEVEIAHPTAEHAIVTTDVDRLAEHAGTRFFHVVVWSSRVAPA